MVDGWRAGNYRGWEEIVDALSLGMDFDQVFPEI